MMNFTLAIKINLLFFFLIIYFLSVTPLFAQQSNLAHTYTFEFSDIKLSKAEIDSLSDLIFDFKGNDLDSMLYLSEKVLLASKRLSYEKGIANSYTYIGIYFYQKGDHSLAIKYYLKAQELWQKAKENNKVASLSNNIGIIYEYLQDYEKAILYHQQAIDQSNESQDRIVLANFYLNYANAKNQLTTIEDALPYYYKAIKMMKVENNIGDLANVYLNLGNTFGRHGIMDSVKIYFDKGLHLARQEENFDNLTYALTSQIRYYTYTQNYQEGLQYAEESLLAAQLSKSKKHIADALFAISNLHENLGNYKEALSAARNHKAVIDSLNIQKHNLEIARLEAASLFVRDKALLDNEIITQEKLLYKRFYIISMLIISITVLLTIGYIFYRNSVKAKKANLVLLKKNKEIEELANQTAALNEHQQIIFKILGHDLKGPVLSLATVTEMASNDLFSLEELNEMLPSLSVQAKQLSLTLENSLRWAMSQMAGETCNPVNVNLTEHIKECLVFLETAIKEKTLSVLLNIDESIYILADSYMMMICIRNVLANAIKFSKVEGMISINCQKEENKVVLTVFNKGSHIRADILQKINEGAVITESYKGTGIGLMLTRSYIIKNKGNMEVRNADGVGVEVRMSFNSSEGNSL